MRLAFICDTPYQTLNVLNMYWHKYRSDKNVQADLFVVDQFIRADQLQARIRQKGLFDNVYFLRREENRFMPQGLKRSIRVAYSYLNPKHAVSNQFDDGAPALLANRYDEIYASLMKCFTAALVKLNPNAVFNLFDDGVGSYTGDLVANGGGLPYKIFSRIFHSGAYATRARKLYVNNVSTCHATAADEICPLPKMSQEFLDVAYRIFQIEPQSGGEGIILLSQPFDSQDATADRMRAFLTALKPWKDKITVRMHPRDMAFDLYSDFKVDKSGQLWELKTAQLDMDRTVLICNFSTAQVTPKMLYDKEPWLIFIHHILKISTPEYMQVIEQEAAQLRDQYRNKDRILIPHSMEELEASLHNVMAILEQ